MMMRTGAGRCRLQRIGMSWDVVRPAALMRASTAAVHWQLPSDKISMPRYLYVRTTSKICPLKGGKDDMRAC